MEDWRKSVLLSSLVLLACINSSWGCSVEGAQHGTYILAQPFLDVGRGIIIDTGVTNILGIQNTEFGGAINKGPYVDISVDFDRVIIQTNANYEEFEEHETVNFISAIVTFNCSPGSPQPTLAVTFRFDVRDTNNNAPRFPPNIAFDVATPVPPNFEFTGCGNEIVVRDIDLTTQAVHFTVDHPDFVIENADGPDKIAKEFKAALRTTASIRSIPEPIILTITATDEDLTGDPRLTTVATVTIRRNTDFSVPDELVFSRTFYHHNYDTTSNEIFPTHPIHLENGFDDEVKFYLHGDLSDYFKLDIDGNSATVRLETALPIDVLSRQYIFFEVRAEREDTLGASSTVIIQLPEARELMFEESFYRGSIENRDLSLGDIRLAVGYDTYVQFELSGEFSNYFTLIDEKNSELTLQVNPTIPENVILENNLIYLTVTATGVNAITTTTSILLDIIKDDLSTPVFSRNIYYGTYGDTIDIQNINLIQGFDKDSVSFKLDGEHSEYFKISGADTNIIELSLSSLNIPEDVIFNEKVLVFNIIAEKALTVGANAAIVIRFSQDLTDTAVMKFSQNTYVGKYENNDLKLDDVILSSGYAQNTEFIVTGEYESYFERSEAENRVSLSLAKDLPTDTIEDSFIVLEIEARRERAATVWTSVVIDIVKQEIVPPTFTEVYYTGVLKVDMGFEFDNVISLASGFDETVIFNLEGELSNYFELVQNSSPNSLSIITKGTLSAETLTEHNHLLFTVRADKPNVNTAHAAIVIDVEKEYPETSTIGFERVSYIGSIQNNAVDLIPITLIEGYTDDVVFALYGALAEYFEAPNEGPEVKLQLSRSIPADQIPESGTIVLDIRASVPETGTAFATIVLVVVTENGDNQLAHLQFDATYYTGSYDASGLSVTTPIVLSEGFEDGVLFDLEGDDSQWFNIVPDRNTVTLNVENGIPAAILMSKQQLVFAVVAQRPGSITARATIVISLTDEFVQTSTIGFERVSYIGSIQNNAVDVIPITLIEGYTDDVVFALYGALAEYFEAPNEGPEVKLQLSRSIPADQIPESGTIVLDIRASVQETGTAFATIVLEVVTENGDNQLVHLQFDATYYTGSYDASGLSVTTPIVLSEGFEDGVLFDLEGDDSQWFNIVPDRNTVTLNVENGIPAAILMSKQQLVFAVVAQRPGSITARATIVISLTDEFVQTSTIGFERVSYIGSIQNNAVDVIPITLIEGYTDDVVFALYGALAEYFEAPNEGPEVKLQLSRSIPADQIPESGTIVLDIRASVPETGTAFATIVLEVVTENGDNQLVHLQFDATYYTGSYDASGLSVTTPIVLSEGFEDGVLFDLEGDDSQWFNIVPDRNTVTLNVENGIPAAILMSKQQLVFAVVAQRPGSITARATIVISLTDEFVQTSTIGFERVSYIGSIQNNAVDVIPITLIEGYTDDVVFALYGALAEYFEAPNEGPEVKLQLSRSIPADQIPESGTIVLDIRASVPETGTAFATIVLEVVTENGDNQLVHLQFDATYYTGSYDASGLSVTTPIVLSEGFEDGVLFDLEGDDSQWFNIVPDRNTVTLNVENGIPAAILMSKQQLVFAVVAQRPGSITARATIVISLTDEFVQTSTIGFERVSYIGSIQNNAVDLIPITLIEGYTDDVVFALYGALAEYFEAPNEGPEVKLQLSRSIPADQIPESGTIVLDIRASVPETGTAFATIVLEVVTENGDNQLVHLQFDATYYTGSYDASGLSVTTPIVLSEGFEDGVLFDLEGDDSQWFNIVPDRNTVTLNVENGIPAAILMSKQQLVFAVVAQRPGSITARATIVISLTDEFVQTSTIGFERVSYIGSIQNNAVDVIPITLIEGYTDDVVFALYGALAEYFEAPNEGPEVKLQLSRSIPADQIPESGTIVLDIRASVPETGTAFATIVLEVVTENGDNQLVHLQFDATYYTGSYDASGLSVTTPIVLSEGFEDGVLFDLEGDDSQWFNIVPDRNTVTLNVENGIPAAILMSKQQLVFAVVAQRPGSITARATIVISLTDEFVQTSTIGFERVSYIGSIQNNAVDVIPITLIEGYTDDVVFALYGALAEYFEAPNEGPEVKLQLSRSIPADQIPESGTIVLDIRASVPETGTAFATIVLEVVTENGDNQLVHLQFDATYYTGSYDASGLSVTTPIVLSEGFEDGVLFDLEGDDSQWFNIVPDRNTVTLNVENGIPAAILMSKQQLVFAVVAQRPGSITARATIVISLTDEFVQTSTIGFERVSYIGSIQNNAVDVIPITLIEGYTDDVVFALYGALAEYFEAPNEGPEVKLQLSRSIPADQIPESGTIVLDIRASVPETGTAFATIVLEVVTENGDNQLVHLQFDATYYTGSYDASGLSVTTPIVLSEGFEDGVLFDLEGDDSQWFNIVPDRNTVTLNVENGIPAAILMSKQQLVFAVVAQRPGSITARATIVISLTDEFVQTSTIGFERVSYIGSIQNNAVDVIPITLIEGYTDDVVFALYGALAEYFEAPNEGPEVKLQLSRSIPADQIPESGTIVLDIRASVPETGTAFATIVLEVVTENGDNQLVHLQFDATYYTGSYDASGLSVTTPIVLSEGFEDGVLFDLEGDDSQWFNIVPDRNTVTLNVENGIPAAILMSKQQLVFAVVAQRPGSITARATIVISLTDEFVQTSTIGFERVSYIGSIQNNAVDLIPITLIEGYTDDAVFALYGALAEYFEAPNEGPEVKLQLSRSIPADQIPESGTIVLDIRASVPETGTAFATIVLEVVTENGDNQLVHLQFDATYYTGSYDASGLSVTTPIVLSEGFEDGVLFDLEGDDSQWFNIVPDRNTVTLNVENGIPAAILMSKQQLVFAVVAQRPGSITARATIVISLTDEFVQTSTIGFERVSYIGSIQNNAVDLIPITLIEGYTDDVVFALYGALAEYFEAPNEGPEVKLQLSRSIPADQIPESGTIVLDIRASVPETGTAFATIVLEVVTENGDNQLVHLQFDATYYTGSYDASGLSVTTPIVLSEGFEDGVLFDLEGDDSQWFNIVPDRNTVTLNVENGIPAAILMSKQQLVFAVVAQRPGSITARATIVISLTDEFVQTSTIGFERVSYIGSIQNNAVDVIPITLIGGYTDDVVFALYGALAEYFEAPNEGPEVKLQLSRSIPADQIPESGTIVLDIRASVQETGTAFATIVLEVVTENGDNQLVHLQFDATYYTGSYDASGLSVTTPIVLSEGFEDGVLFDLEGDDSQWFNIVPDRNTVTLNVENGIPAAILMSKQQLVFAVVAQRPGSITARATIVISLTDEFVQTSTIGFERVSYIGSIQNNAVDLIPITLIEGYTDDVVFALYGALAEYFEAPNEGPEVKLQLSRSIPADQIPESGTIVLDIRASVPETGTAFATIVLEVVTENGDNQLVHLQFDATYYTGSYDASGLSVTTPIVLSEGFEDGVLFDLEGDDSQWFNIVPDRNTVTLNVENGIPAAILMSKQQLVFAVVAQRPGSITARATIVISLTDEFVQTSTIGFERVSYIGSIQNNAVDLIPITLIEGYTDDAVFALYGALAEYFEAPNEGPEVKLQLSRSIPADQIPESGTIVLDIRASVPETGTAFATIVLEVVTENGDNQLVHLQFDATYYTGSYDASGLSVTTPIVLSEGYEDGVLFDLEGDDSQWFNIVPDRNTVTLNVENGIPAAILMSKQQLVFAVVAQRPGSITARATIVISLTDGFQGGENLLFEKVLYRGNIELGEVKHDDIIIRGFDGTTVLVIGEYSDLFVAFAVDGVVTVTARGSVNLPADVTQLDLELRAATARTALLLDIKRTEPLDPEVPRPPATVTFSSESYAVTVEMVQTGIVGRVLATTDNEEGLMYSLANLNAHLQSRLSINNEGELFLSAPANSGVYTFQVIATTDITEATGTATVHLTVQSVMTCGDDIVVHPLITLDRDEEQPHNDLVPLNATLHEGCHYLLTSLFPADQDWLYVDENGLHARSIDREDKSIAFMALSQVQVELILHCETDNNIRTKRSERTDWLGPYDYGTKNWILTDSILYNSRRSLVNLIVNDINDNYPIFEGKEHEPIVVGYPIDELEERILPRSLVELKATDADIGLNAALRYSSTESALAVAPTTGFVHVQSSAQLVNNQILTVNATDRDGTGLTGSIQLVVKLLTADNIAVVTVRNAFLDQESSILKDLSTAVGYDVKSLRSVVISEDTDTSRQSQDSGASLQLYVYGVIDREPVAVDRLTENINSNSEIVNLISTVSLEDHLDDIVIQRDIGLLVATIVLSILLFILILLIAVWYFLRWRKNRNYDEFSDKNSLASRNESLGDLSKPAESQPVATPGLQPRLNIEELKKSERRLQEMLDAPIEEVTVEPVPVTSKTEPAPLEAILDISMPEINVPIVIQSIDKLKDAEESDDEFGEINKTPRKSVVTFNENVEKIIHVEDDTDNSSQSGYEIYKF